MSGRSAGRGDACAATQSCPKILEANSSNEYWVKGASLLHTDLAGQDAPEAPFVRTYLVASLPHQRAAGMGICQQPRNPLGGGPVLRALLVALDQWVSADLDPPQSRVPRVDDGTLVPALPQTAVGFPSIPGVLYDGLMTTGERLSFGKEFAKGKLTTLPPERLPLPAYPVLVPATDADGHDRAGIRLPDVAVPIATHTGWARRASAYGGADLCDQFGQRIPFPRTRAEREGTGDARASIEERYPTHDDYVEKVGASARALVEQRLMLREDADRIVEAARESDVRR